MTGALARWRGRWRVALRYGWRDARRNKGRTALVAVMVVLPVALGSFATTMLWSARDTPESVAQRELGPHLQAVVDYVGPGVSQEPAGGSVAWDGEHDGPAQLSEVESGLSAAMPRGDTLLPVIRTLSGGVDVHADDLQLSGETMQADLADQDLATSFELSGGALPEDGEIAISSSMADTLGVSIGDTVTTTFVDSDGSGAPEPASVSVSGLLDGVQPQHVDVLFPDSGPLAPPKELSDDGQNTWVQWFVAGDAPVTWYDVLALNKIGVSVVSRSVLFDPPPDETVPMYAGAPDTSAEELLQRWAPFAAVAAVALLEVVLLIGPAFAVGARRSARSLAVIAAGGGTVRALRAVVLGTGIVIGAVSSVLGAALGVLAAVIVVDVASDDVVVLPWLPVTGILLVGVGIATTAAWLPARTASKADVVAVLSGRRGEVGSRRWPAVVGAVLGVGGFAGAVVAATAARPLLLAAGVIVGELGLVLACGGIVALLGRLARHLPLAWRFALRDAARHRGRTAPALAAVLVAVAGASGGLVYASSQSVHEERSQVRSVAPGALTIGSEAESGPAGLSDEAIRRVDDVVHGVLPDVGELHPVRTLGETDGTLSTTAWATPPPEHRYQSGMGYEMGAVVGPVVDDGALVEILGVPEPEAARAALAEGHAVAMAGDLWQDGDLHVTVSSWDDTSDDEVDAHDVSLPATGVGDPLGPNNTTLPLVPPPLVDDLGVDTVVTALAAMPDAPPTRAERETVQAALDDEFGLDQWDMCRVCMLVGEPAQDYGTPEWLSTLLIVGGAGILALAAAWIAAALAATESRPDLATMAAVGAAPTTRKRVVAAQAGTIAVVGSVLGAASGLALGAAFVLFERYRWETADLRWTVEVPWPVLGAMVVGLPLLAVTAAWLATRSRLVLTRRLAS